ncbi:MAG: lyase family protein [Stappiaceae bacterium]
MSYSLGSDAMLNLFTDDSIMGEQFSFSADLSAMIDFERALARAEGSAGLISSDHAGRIAEALDAFEPDYEALRAGFLKDGAAPPSLVAQIRQALDPDIRSSFHFGGTSQDLMDTSLMVRLKRCVALSTTRLKALDDRLALLADCYSDELKLQARTRMQIALPISVREKIRNWRTPISRLSTTKPTSFPLQLGGPEGEARKLGAHYAEIAGAMAEMLGLDAPENHWQTDRQPLMGIAFWFSQIASAMGKIGQDVLFMCQSEVGEARLAGGGSSSAMPHKQNPVRAEIVVALARYCQTQMNGLNTASIHENERSGTAWTLEWMLLPALVVATGSILSNTTEMLDGLTFAEGRD